jgi:hypothetical protein
MTLLPFAASDAMQTVSSVCYLDGYIVTYDRRPACYGRAVVGSVHPFATRRRRSCA